MVSASDDGTCTAALPAGVTEFSLVGGGAEHEVRFYAPRLAVGTDMLPLVLNWHGLTGDGPEQAAFTGYEELAEREGFLVAHPTGLPSPDLPFLDLGVGWELLEEFNTPTRDDVGFAVALIDELVERWCADRDRVYSVGMSNGGLFTSAFLCERADVLAAAASIAGVYHPESCAPSRPVPYMAVHGASDDVVPLDPGGPSMFPSGRPLFRGMLEAFSEFAADAGCEPEPTAEPVGQSVIRHEFVDCAEGTPMVFLRVIDGEHSWQMTNEVNTTEETWAFFQAHSRAE